MKNSCVRIPQCRREDGTLVNSGLFLDLLEYSNNDRKFAKQMYALAKNEDFVDRFKSQLDFDENGEPTLRSLFAVSKVSLNEEKIIAMLDKQLGAGEYSWEEALALVEKFNSVEHRTSEQDFYERELRNILINAPVDSEGRLLAPNHKPSNLSPIQYATVRTKAFKDWFGDWENDPKNASKVLDENGEPLVVYHGGAKDISVFKHGKEAIRDNGLLDDSSVAMFFSDSVHVAHFYSGKLGARYYDNLNLEFSDTISDILEKHRYSLKEGGYQYVINDDEYKQLLQICNDLYKLKLPGFKDISRRLRNAIVSIKENGDAKKPNAHIVDKIYYSIIPKMSSVFHDTYANYYIPEHHYANNSSLQSDNDDYTIWRKQQNIGQLYSVFLNIKNPLSVDYEGEYLGGGSKVADRMSEQVNKAIKEGYDGVVYKNVKDPQLANNYGVFSSNQIKSAEGSNGEFSPSDPNIYHNKLKDIFDIIKNIKWDEVFNGRLEATHGFVYKEHGKYYITFGSIFKNSVDLLKSEAEPFLQAHLTKALTDQGINPDALEFKVTPGGRIEVIRKDVISKNTGKRTIISHSLATTLSFLKSKIKGLNGEELEYKVVRDTPSTYTKYGIPYGTNAFFKDGVVYLIEGKFNEDMAIEECLHPLVNAIYSQNRKLFNALAQEAKETFPTLYEEIKHSYDAESVEKELVTQALSRHTRVENQEQNGTRTKWQQLVDKFYKAITDLFGIFRIKNIKPTTTFADLAKVILSEEGVFKVAFSGTEFNKSTSSAKEQWSSDYMATMTDTQDGKVRVHTVKRTPAAETALHQKVANQTLQQKIVGLLKQHGVAVDFLTKGKNQYSTENAQRTADGLYHLIQIVQGKTDVTPEVAEEAGHFAVAALGNSPLVTRLENMLTPEVQKQALGEEYNNKYLGRDARREVAGDLVGKALLKRMSNNTWGRLANRIADLAKRVFYKMKADEVSVMRLDAERAADRIARNFMSENFEGSLENALSTEETLYSTEYSEQVKTYKNILGELQVLSDRLRATNSKWADRVLVIIAKMQMDREARVNQQIGALADFAALEGIAEAVDMLVDAMTNDIPKLLESVNFDNIYDFATNMARNGKSLREAHMITKSCLTIAELIARNSSYLSNDITVSDPITGNAATKNIISLQSQLAKFINKSAIDGFYDKLMKKERAFFIKFLEDAYGKKYIERSARVVFNKRLAKMQGRNFVAFRESENQNFDYLLDNLENDINFFDKFFSAMADSGDIIGEIVDKAMKQANKEADDMTNKVWDDLKAIEERARKAGVKDPQVIYERDPKTGKLTGNLIDQLLWGVWEKEYEDFMKEQKKVFVEQHANDPNFINRSELEKTLAWQAYFEPIRKAWHKEHSTFKPDEGWIPKDSMYHNYEYDKLAKSNPGAIQLLHEIMSTKEMLDSMVNNGMPIHRAPQFKGTFMNSIRNKGSRANPKSYVSVWWQNLKDSITVDADDAGMYGSTLTYNEPDEDIFATRVSIEKENINRIPLFGINKLKNMDMLSTDIYASMLSYASMATHYAAINQVVDTAEIGKEILRGRKVGGTKTEEERDKTSWAFTRYCKYLDKQMYGVGNKPIIIGKVVLNKITSGLTRLASKLFLGGNIPGGIVNLGTGEIEIFKEALSAEFFDTRNLVAAKAYYIKNLPATLLQLGKVDKDDRLSLIIRHFNMLNNNKEQQRKYSTYRSRAKHIYDESALFPYSAGDHYMQSIPCLALMDKQKLIRLDGSNAGSLLDVYDKAAIEYIDSAGRTTQSKKYGSTIKIEGPYFKTEEDRQEYLMLKSIVESIDSATPSVFGPTISLSQEQMEYLDRKGWRIADVESTRKLAAREMQVVQWNSDDESALMDKGREIDNRLHGIYNEQDKTELHQQILGAMLLGMRGYALGLIQRRFGGSKYSIVLGGEVEGSLLTFSKVVASSFTDRWGFGKTIQLMIWPWSKNARAKMESAGFSTNQYRNMRRCWVDFVVVTLLTLLKALCAEDDDDKKTEKDVEEIVKELKAAGFTEEEIDSIIERMQTTDSIDGKGVAYYFISRWLREQTAYNMGWDMGKSVIDEWSNITSLIPAGVSAVLELVNLTKYCFGDLFYDHQQMNPEKYKMMKELGFTKEEITEEKARDREAIKDAAGKWAFYPSNGSDGIYKKGDPKWERKLGRALPFPVYIPDHGWYWNYTAKTMNVLEHPYQAAKSFEYGRKVRN